MDPLITDWLAALERRHLADLTMSEVARALRALSSCYVERRAKLAEGGALSSAGKRAAFALFYGPQHLLITQAIISALPSATEHITDVIDLGCGTGAAGAAWALAAGSRSIRGFDRHPWAIAEASWTYRQLQLQNKVIQANIATAEILQHTRRGFGVQRGTAILAAYAANELAPDGRAAPADLSTRCSCARRARARRRADCPALVTVVGGVANHSRARRWPRRRVAIPGSPSRDSARARPGRWTRPPGAHRSLALSLR